MRIDLKKSSHILLFVVFLSLLSWATSVGIYKLIPETPFWMESLTPLGAYILYFTLFEKYAWSWKIFRMAGVVNFPDLRGRWEGDGISTYKDENGNNVRYKGVLEIKQSFGRVVVEAFFEKSQSKSVIADFHEFDGDVFLYYNYDNEPNSFAEGTMQNHKGTVKLRYLKDENRLMGSYFNSIKNRGDFDFKWKGEKLKGRF